MLAARQAADHRRHCVLAQLLLTWPVSNPKAGRDKPVVLHCCWPLEKVRQGHIVSQFMHNEIRAFKALGSVIQNAAWHAQAVMLAGQGCC